MDPVTDRHESVQEILSANRRFARSTARSLEELVTPFLEDGKPMPDFVHVQQLLAAALESRWHCLSQADEGYDDADAHRHALIGERDDEVGLLYRELADLRTILRGRFGAEPSRRLIGLRGDTSRDPVVILRQADRAVRRLRDLARPLPPSKARPASADRWRWAAPVADAAGTLRAIVGRAVAAVKELDAARRLRKHALEDFNCVFVWIAGLFEALYRATGRDDRAAVVRPSRRHPGKTYLQVKKAQRPAPQQEPEPKPGVTARLIAPIRQIFDRRRSA